MRLAISLLTLIAVLSTIGTLLRQNEPAVNYVNQFGGFWADIFAMLGLYRLYNASGFLLVLGFLVLSTTLCLWRNTPKILAQTRRFPDQVRRTTLAAFAHHRVLEWPAQVVVAEPTTHAQNVLHGLGYRTRVRVPPSDAQARLVVGKRGSASRYGYIFTHAAIVIICVGGLLDSDLLIKSYIRWGGRVPIAPQPVMRDIPASAQLPVQNPVYRASLFVPEGATVSQALVSLGDRVLVQPLPFQVHLRRFIVDYYSTGSPKRFASDVDIIDGKHRFAATISVNAPLTYRGVTLYQSSFDDGGSHIRLQAYPLQGNTWQPVAVAAQVGQEGKVLNTGSGKGATRLEITGLRLFNVENLQSENARGRTLSISRQLERAVAPAADPQRLKRFRNLGPSVQYKLRDSSGQAREFDTYAQPVDLDGQLVFLAGVRDQPDAPFEYWRLPADSAGRPDTFLALRAALQDPAQRQRAIERLLLNHAANGAPAAPGLKESAQRALETFAEGGLRAVARQLEQRVPATEQTRAAEVVAKLITSMVYALWESLPAQNGVASATQDAAAWRFVQAAVGALSDATQFNSPVVLFADSFTPVQASVLQAARAPGRYAVYFGCALLLIGTFAMFYIRERRVWLWWSPATTGGGQWTLALSSSRHTLAAAEEFDTLVQRLDAPARAGPSSGISSGNSPHE